MILNEFFNLPQVFEKDMIENEKTLAIGQQMAQDGIVYDHTKEDQLIGIMGEYMERNGMTPKQIRYYLSYDEDFVPDQLSYLPKNGDDAETFVQSEYVPRGREEEMDEGIFGSKPSPVLPIVAKIDRVARELTPQNVETGKQIIQSHTRDITRMLSPQDKAGVDVIEQGMAEAKDDYVPPKEANYDDKYQAMVRRVGEKARAQEKAKQQQPKAPVRESRLALLKQIVQS